MRRVYLLLMLLIVSMALGAKNIKSTVAVVIDDITYSKIKSNVDSYSKSLTIKSNNKIIREGVVLANRWDTPDQVKEQLYMLYKSSNLEGAIFIGDIPIPMIRDAHHLTTAFKMDPRRDWKESSVASDRFYDDFDLQFKYIKQDEQKPLYHYYSLLGDGPQYIDCDIYSARVKPPLVPGKDKYELIAEFLDKCVSVKRNNSEISKVLHFAGHGYNSESFSARIDEAAVLYEQFPQLLLPQKDLEYIDFTQDEYIKNRLLSTLSNSNLDLAILHHHGGIKAQYLNGYPNASMPKEWFELSKAYFRSKIRDAKEPEKTKERYAKEFNLPIDWFGNPFIKESILKDSLQSAGMDINIPDLYNFKSNPKFILIDACFNGCFKEDDYISAYYIFNAGNTVAVKANSVNTLQDTWTNELLGLLNMGVSIGNWSKNIMTLESHIIGDPTYSYLPIKENSLDRDIVNKRRDVKYWRELLKSVDSECRVLAIKMLIKNNAIKSEELLNYLKNDRSPLVRLESFMGLSDRADDCLIDALKVAMKDPYELTRRMATKIAAKSGSDELIEDAAKLYLDPMQPTRIAFHLKDFTTYLDANKLVEELKKQREEMFVGVKQEGVYVNTLWPNDDIYNAKLLNLIRTEQIKLKEYNEMLNPSIKERDLRLSISAQRNLCHSKAVDALLYLISKDSYLNDELKIRVIECLGWYKYSYRKDEIIKSCEDLYKDSKGDIKNELIKTINRLK